MKNDSDSSGSGSGKMTGALMNLPMQHERKQVKNKRFSFSDFYLFGLPLDIVCLFQIQLNFLGKIPH